MEAARVAQRDDGEQVAALRGDAQQALYGARGGRMLEAERSEVAVSWATWLDDPGRLAVVGTLDDHVVGYGLASLRRLDSYLLGVIEEVWVEVAARGVGVGEALMDSITAWCTEAGCSGLDAVALPGDRTMKGFFERYGLTARLLVMHRPLSTVPPG